MHATAQAAEPAASDQIRRRGFMSFAPAAAGTPGSVFVGPAKHDHVTREALQRHVRIQLDVLIVERQPKILPHAVGDCRAGRPGVGLTGAGYALVDGGGRSGAPRRLIADSPAGVDRAPFRCSPPAAPVVSCGNCRPLLVQCEG